MLCSFGNGYAYKVTEQHPELPIAYCGGFLITAREMLANDVQGVGVGC